MVRLFYLLCLLNTASFIDCSDLLHKNFNLDFSYRNVDLAETLQPIIKFFTSSGYSTVRINVVNASNFETLDIANDVMRAVQNVKILSRALSLSKSINVKQISPVILILQKASDFKLIEAMMAEDNTKYYLVMIMKEDGTNLSDIAKSFWKKLVPNVNFLIQSGGNFSLLTFFPFGEAKCGDQMELKLINSFNKKWTSNVFFPEKVKNLNQCEIKIAINPSVPFTIIKIDNQTNSKMFDGIEVQVIRLLGEEYNFAASFEGPHAVIGAIYSNGSSSGLLSLVYTKKVDVVIGTLSLQIERLKFLAGTTFFMADSTILTMPQAAKLTPFIKLIMPFDLTTWILMIFMYTFGILIVIFTRFASKTVYEFIVGTKVAHPILNMLIAFVGTTQSFLPRRTFSRFLLAKFLIFCLVMRGLYQGKLFDIMHRDIYEKDANTIDELIDRKLIFYTYESLSRRVQGFKFTNRMAVIPFAEIEKYQRKTLDSSFNGVVFSYEAQVLYENSIHRKDFFLVMCKERLVQNQLVFYLQRNHFLAEKFSEKILWFREFGISNHIISKYVDTSFANKIIEEKEKEPLSFHELSATFGVWLGGLGVAAIVLVLELIYGMKLWKKRN